MVVVTKTTSIGLEDLRLIQKLAKKLGKSDSAVIREAIRELAEKILEEGEK